MCSLCISYCKHAMMFRQQIINNTKWLSGQPDAAMRILNNNIAASAYNRFNPTEDNDDSDDQQQLNADWNNTNFASETLDNLKFELDSAFGGAYESSDDDDDDEDIDPSANATLLFDYKEKKFEEDDISEFGCFKSANSKILITIPDEMRERKCEACRKRFMLKESFEQHLKECIELKILTFITEGYQLLMMRKSRSLSANDFVRRMIFSLKKLVKSLTYCYNEVVDVAQSDDKNVKKSKFGDITGGIAKIPVDNLRRNLNNAEVGDSNHHQTNGNQSDSDPSKKFLNLLEGKPNVFIQKNRLNQSMFTNPSPLDGVTPINEITPTIGSGIIPNDHSTIPSNNINSNNSNNIISFNNNNRQVLLKSTILHNNQHINNTADKLLKNHFESDPSIIRSQVRRETPVETVIAQCSSCSESFTSLQLFEEHNRKFHNIATSSSSTASNSSHSPHMMLSSSAERRSSSGKRDELNADERNKLLKLLTIKF